MTDLAKLFDHYNRRARLYPALLALFPPLLLLAARFPSILSVSDGKLLATVFGSVGGLYLLSSVSRSAGKKTESRLLKKWGGLPTTIWLRHRDSHLSATTKQRYHDFLSANVPRLRLPTTAQEQDDPVRADEIYASAIQWLKEQRRGKKHALILKESTEYGFRRNMRGLRWLALGANIGALGAWVVSAWSEARSAGISEGSLPALGEHLASAFHAASPMSVFAICANLAMALFWSFYVRDQWVRESGDSYARVLLASCD